MAKITKSLIDKSILKEKDYIVWDDEVKGFGCRIFPSGKKTYVFYYTSPTTRKFAGAKIGVHGNITADIARDVAKTWSADIVHGKDPRERKRTSQSQEQKSMLFEGFWNIFTHKYIHEHHKPSTIQGDSSRIKKYILPFFSGKNLKKITREDVLSFADSIRHTRGNCTKCLRLLSVAFNQAELWGYREAHTNPCRGVPKFADRKMERFLRHEELVRLEEVLKLQEQSSKSSFYTIAAIRMLLYTGCREGEILTLRWENVHLKERYLYLEDSKVGVRTVALNEKSYEILNGLLREPSNPYVFCGKNPGHPLKEIKTTWHKVRTLAGIPDVRIHDLRHSFASFALKQGVDLYTVSKLLGHKNIQTTTRYAHLELDHLKKASNVVAKIFNQGV